MLDRVSFLYSRANINKITTTTTTTTTRDKGELLALLFQYTRLNFSKVWTALSLSVRVLLPSWSHGHIET